MGVNWMNKTGEIYKLLLIFLFGFYCCSFGVLKAQQDSCYEFKCDYFDDYYTCPIQWYGDTMLVVTHLFDEISISNEVSFTFQDSCVYLTIDGQKGLFWGNSKNGSWNITEEEHQRFTVKWDSLFCTNNNDTIFKFEFVPYYHEKNPYIKSDGSEIFHYYCDMISYYWIRSAGVIAFVGDWFYVRKDFESYKDCLKKFE